MADIIQFPKPAEATQQKTSSVDIFRDLSDLIGVDLHKVLVHNDQEETKQLHRKLQKETMIIRSKQL